MKYRCPECGGFVEADGDCAGLILTCPHCQKGVEFVAAEGVSRTEPPPLPPPIQGPGLAELALGQPLGAVSSVVREVRGFCTPGEQVEKVAIQSRWMVAGLKPDAIVGTDRRVIVLRRGIFGCDMWDAFWVDVGDVKVRETITGTSLTVMRLNGTGVIIERLMKAAGRAMYQHCQAMEERIRYLRHAQQIHLAQAGASNVQVNVNR